MGRLCGVSSAILWVGLGVAAGAESPDARPATLEISGHRRVYDNGEHNAFTDLVRFRDRLYLAFRSCPDGHGVFPSASVVILTSADGTEWREVYRFRVPDRDTRDPHFLVFRDRLFVYTGTWYCANDAPQGHQLDVNDHLGYGVVSADGERWSEPRLLEGTFGHYVWRGATYDGKAYLCARRKIGFAIGPKGEGDQMKSLMLESDDGWVWRARSVFQEEWGDETAFLFEPDGTVVGIGRRGRQPAELLRAAPPYQTWQRKQLSQYVGGPLLVRWQGRYLVGGRKITPEQGPTTALYWLIDDQLVQCGELPSGGDCSYPGFVPMGPNHGLVSWYSSHGRDANGQAITAIYLADVKLPED